MKKIFSYVVALAMLFITGCTRIETGEVGMRVNFDKTISTTELQPGSWNQVLIGDVITFPVKDIAVRLENKQPLTAENTALADFDVTVVYGINNTSVAELYTQKSRSFHTIDKDGDTLLMSNYVTTIVNNATYKAVRQYKALEVADNRAKIEEQIKQYVLEQLRAEKLDAAINLSVVQVTNVQPNPEILKSASAVVAAENALKAKAVEVETARKEAERMQALSANSERSVAFMDAQARLNISDGVKNGKVTTIVVPHDFKGFVNTGK
jgi:regulator of protease activity HflC (stomatin/prohibitin superfamily)